VIAGSIFGSLIYSAPAVGMTVSDAVYSVTASEADSYSVDDPFERLQIFRSLDRKFIGEFIRLHHPRLAHEFALFGIPGPRARIQSRSIFK